MLNAMSIPEESGVVAPTQRASDVDTVGTLLDLAEWEFLHGLYHSGENASPKFAIPDLVSACVSLVFSEPVDAKQIVFEFVRTDFTLRSRAVKPRRCSIDIWRPQYEVLRSLQVSGDNRYPNPKFDLGDFTTACVALVMGCADAQAKILDQARKNSVNRARESDRPPARA